MVQVCDLNLHAMFPPQTFTLGLPQFIEHARQALGEVLNVDVFALPYTVVLGNLCPPNLIGQRIIPDVVDMVLDIVLTLRQESQLYN